MPEISVQHQCTDLTDLIDGASFGEPVGPLRCRPEGSATRHGVAVFTKVFSFVHGSVCRRDQVFHIVAVVRGDSEDNQNMERIITRSPIPGSGRVFVSGCRNRVSGFDSR